MILRRPIKIISGLLLFLAVAIGLTSINHPIIVKWVTGSARHHGSPMPATVYTNGKATDNIKVYYTDEADHYVLSLTEHNSTGALEFVNINLSKGWIGRPVGASENKYDVIAGHLFQSESDAHLTAFQDEVEGFNFNPQLSFTKTQIKFNMLLTGVKFDSIRIELP